MVKVYDVPADTLIDKLSNILKNEDIVVPSWMLYVKTGAHKKRQPQNSNWWYIRSASILRKIYLHGPVSINDLRKMYGGTKYINYSTSRHKSAGGSIIRYIVHALEKLDYIKKTKNGRIISTQGMKKLDRLSHDIFNELCIENTSLKIYAE